MPYSFEEKSPGDLSTLGLCGISQRLTLTGQHKIFKDGLGNVLDEFYKFTQNYTSETGCHEVRVGSNRTKLRVSAPDRPIIDDMGADFNNPGLRRTRETYNIMISMRLDDFCGPCYNPHSTGVENLYQLESSMNPSGPTEATRLWGILDDFTRGLDGAPYRPGIPELRRLFREWYLRFGIFSDLPGNPATPFADPCDPAQRTLCATVTP